MSMTFSTAKQVLACCAVLLTLAACGTEGVAEPAAETPPSTESASLGASPSTELSSAQESERADALGDLATAASEQAAALPTLLLFVNQMAEGVLLTSADAKNTATIGPGKSLQLASKRVCDWLPLKATTSDGQFIEEYAQPCNGQTWTITD